MSEMEVFWVGQKPGRPMTITVANRDGVPFDLSAFTGVEARMLDPKNREVDLEGAEVTIVSATEGRVSFAWPTDRSLFEKAGEYVFQIVLLTGNSINPTSRATFRVRSLGGKN